MLINLMAYSASSMPGVNIYFSNDNYRFLLEKQQSDNKHLAHIVNEIVDDYRTKDRDMNAFLHPAVSKELHDYVNEVNIQRSKLQQAPLSALDFINRAIEEKIKEERIKRLLA